MNETLILLASNALTSIATWFVSRKRQQADTDNQILKNMELVVSSYKVLIEDLKTEIESLNIKIQELEQKIDVLHTENRKLRTKKNSL
jgi:uncharacterized protein Yka (UPF0111/DUF47 family)